MNRPRKNSPAPGVVSPDAAAFTLGDLVSFTEKAMRPRLRGGACSVEELQRLRVVAVKADKDGSPMYRLVTKDHAPVGWAAATELVPAD